MMPRWRLRTWLLALVVATAVPCSAVIVWQSRSNMRAQEQEAARHVLALAVHTAQHVDRTLDEVRATLEALARRPGVQRLDPQDCDPIFADLRALTGDYRGVDVMRPDGAVVCTTPPWNGIPYSHAGEDWLLEAVQQKHFTIGKPHRAHGKGSWLVVLAVPVIGEGGEVLGVIGVALDLVAFGSELTPDAGGLASATVLDKDGTVVALSQPDVDDRIGQNRMFRPTIARAIDVPLTSYVETDRTGVQRIYASALAAHGQWRVLISIAERDVLAAGRARGEAALRTDLLLTLVAAAFTFWLSGRLARPIQALAAAARGATTGAATAHVPEEGPQEVREAVARFNELSAARSASEAALRQSNERITQQGRLLRTTASVSQMIAREEDRQRVLEGACRVLVEQGGMGAAWVGFAEPETGRVVATAAAGFSLGDLAGVRFDDTPEGNGPVGRAIRTGEMQLTQDVRADERSLPFRVLFERYGFRANAAFPLRERGNVIGAVAVCSADPHAFPPEVTALIGDLARDVGLALQHLDDLAERRAAEAALKRSQSGLIVADRLASVGRLAAGVAHEINNPLAYVVMNTTVALEELQRAQALATPELRSSLEEASQALREARSGSERVRLIVRDLKLFSRADAETRGPVDLNKVIESSVSIAWNEIRTRALLVKDLAVLPEVEANDSRLGQVFLNLIINAAQAIEPGAAERNEVRIVTRREGDRAIVEVRDTGCGIPPELQKKIFEPFFTTKAAGVGTGLGLAICHSIVADLGGELTVTSEVGKGSIFTVKLPLSTSAAVQPPLPSPRAPAPGRRARLLVVDDEAGVGNAIRRALAAEHDVTFITSGREALERIAAGEKFDALLCDLMMPEMSGMALHEQLTRIAPPLAEGMIVMTGGVFTAAAQEFLDRVHNPRVEKPFDVASLRALVRSVLR